MSFARGVVGMVVALAGCAPPGEPIELVAAPIIGGKFQPGDPAVVALLDIRGLLFCSGTLVSPHVVVTAAHCLVYGGTPGFVYFGSDPALGGDVRPVASAEHHVDFDEQLKNDVAVVILAEPAPAEVVPAPMARRAPKVGMPARFVGFGCRDTGPQPCEEAGLKYDVSTAIVEVGARDFRYGVATCQGDSGGPAFVDEAGREVLAGLTSWGDTPCEEYGYDTRVDAYRGWVIERIAEADPDFQLDDPPLPGEDDDDGCGCRVAGRSSGIALAPLLLGLVLFRRRRRD